MAISETSLEQARRHVVAGRRVLARQRDLVERLRSLRLNSADAEDLLDTFERSQAIFEDDLRRFEARAAESN